MTCDGGSMTITFTIAPAKQAQTITASDVTATYGDTGVKINASTTGDGGLSYAVRSGDTVTVDASGNLTINKAGSAVITVTAAETDTYAQATKDVNVTISTKAMTVSAEDVNATVDGQPHGITVTVTDPASGATVKYGTEAGSYTLDASPTQTEVGEKTVYYQVTSDNYTTYTGSAKVTVSAKQPQTITAENVTANYGDTGKSIEASTSGDGTLSYAVKSGDAVTVNETTGALTIVKAGSAVITVTASETATYAQATKEVTVTINKANAVPATVTANNRTYDGTEKPLVTVTGTPTGGEMQYALGTATEATQPYTTFIPTATDAGTYYVWYKVIGDANHNDSEPVSINASIAKRSVTLTSATDSKQYDGDALTNDSVTVTGDGFVNGEGATYEVTGTQTLPGHSANTFGYTLNQGTKADNYIITKVEGTLIINDREAKYEISPQAKSDTVKYDGQEHTVTGLVTDTFTVNDHTYTVSGLTVEGKGTNAANYQVTVTGTAVVKDSDGNDVTKEFSVQPISGTLSITKRDVTLTSASGSKVYDGIALTNDEVTVSGDGFAQGEGASYNVSGRRLPYGTSENTFSYTLNDGTIADNYNITTQYGLLTVNHRDTKYAVTLTANSASEKYDGTEKTVSGFSIDADGDKQPDEVTADAETGAISFTASNGKKYTLSGMNASLSATDAGDYTVNITGTPLIVDGEGNDETAEFTVNVESGKLSIGKRSVTLTSATDSKAYDGTALTNSDVEVNGDGFADGEGAHYTFTGSQTLPGYSANAFSYDLNEGTKPGNYEITKTEGTLTITDRTDEGEDKKYEIKVTAKSGEFLYDGSEKSVSGFETLEFNVNGVNYTVEGLSAEAVRTDAGTTAVEVTGTPVVKNSDGVDLTKEFIVKTENGSLTINKRSVTLTSATDSKQYYGDALTNDTVTVTGDGFAQGEGASYNVTGSQTLPNHSANSFGYTLNEGTKADNYTITKVEGTLTVNDREAKYEISPQAKSDTTKYDGQEHSVTGLVTDTFEVDGHAYTVSGLTAEGKGTNAGTYQVAVTGTAVVKDSNGNDVTKEFSVQPISGTLTITKREITLTSASGSKEYDGTALTNSEVTVSGDGFAEGEGASYTVTGRRLMVGTGDNTFTYELNNNTLADNYTITTHFGSLTVNHRDAKYKLTLTANSKTEKYDGQAKNVSGYTIDADGDGKEEASASGKAEDATSFTASNGKQYTISGMITELTKTDAGEYTVTVYGTPHILDEEGNDETAEFAIETVSGKLTIQKRSVTLTSATDSKAYDGSALTNGDVTVGGDGFANGEGAHYTFTGSQTLPGSSANAFSYDLDEGTKAGNYEITKTEGTLTITDRTDEGEDKKYEITVKTKSDSVLYDGKEHTIDGFETLEFTVNGVTYHVTGITASAKGTDAGSYPVTIGGISALKVLNPDGVDLTKEFIVNLEIGSLDIEKRAVTLTSKSDSKQYDGDALTNDTVTVTGDGFAEGEGASYNVSGSQTLAGSSANTFTYELNDGTKPGNYSITKVEGTLAVADREAKYEIAPQAKSETLIYDGEAHTVSGFVTETFEVEGHSYTVTGLAATVTGTDAGSYTVQVSGTPTVRDMGGNDVTKEFLVNPKSGSLTITKRNVTLTSATDSKEYDGSALTNSEVTESGDGFASGEGATYEVSGTRTVPGSAENVFSYTLKDGAKADNYNITTVFGTLTVNHRNTKYKLKLTAGSDTAKYDGTEKTVLGYTIDANGDGSDDAVSDGNETKAVSFTAKNGKTYTLTGLRAVVTGTNAGEYALNIVGTPHILDENGNDETAEFAIETVSGKLTIEKRELTLSSASDSKAYDGLALTNDEITEGGDGFASGEGAHYSFTGTQTLTGSSENTFSYDLNEGTKAGNYEITCTYGTLSVTKSDADAVKAPTGKELTYNGQEQELAEPGSAEGGEMQYALGEDADTAPTSGWSTSVPGGTDAGTYYVWYRVIGDANHNDTEPECVVSTIAHSFEEVAEVPASCETDGVQKHWKDETGKLYKDAQGLVEAAEEELVIKATDHDWAEPSYEWSADNSSVTAKHVCNNDAAHVETETVDTTSSVTKEATCEEKGETTYTTKPFANPAFKEQTKTLDNIDATDHDWGEWTVTKEATELEEGSETRSCKNDPSHTETRTIPVIGHVHQLTKVEAKDATCTEPGNIKYWTCAEGENPCKRFFADAEGKTEINEEDTKVKATGHDWGEPTYEWAEDNSSVTATRTCKNDPSHVETETVDVTPVVTKEATETEEGETTYTATFSNDAFKKQTKTEKIPKQDPKDDTDKDPEEITYRNTEGNGTQWTKGSNKTADFTFKRSENDSEAFSHFTGIQVDGKDVDKANYTADSESVIVKLKPAYLETLSVGEHTLTALFDDGNAASAKFTILAKSTNTNSQTSSGTAKKANVVNSSTTVPKTGDKSNMLLWITLLCASMLVIFNVINARRRNTMGRR